MNYAPTVGEAYLYDWETVRCVGLHRNYDGEPCAIVEDAGGGKRSVPWRLLKEVDRGEDRPRAKARTKKE